mmetsp:Transcript_1009/g.2883  ORF Transcript_1009/g.2883 Transcript_1009/m.2883 type:complete len:125 (-) Transcript_1009:566-940(-)
MAAARARLSRETRVAEEGSGVARDLKKAARLEDMERRRTRVAVKKLGSFVKEEVVEREAKELLEKLEKAGLVSDRDMRRVRLGNYNCKVGFNTRGELAMASFFDVPFWKLKTELVIELDDDAAE